MICSRIPGSRVAAYCRNQPSTRSTARSSPGRTSLTAGLNQVAWTTGLSEVGRPRGLGGRVERSHFYPLIVVRNRNGCRAAEGAGELGERAGPGEQRRDLVAELVAQEGGRRQQRLQVVAGVQAHPLQQVDQVVGGDVAGRPWGERAAAD